MRVLPPEGHIPITKAYGQYCRTLDDALLKELRVRFEETRAKLDALDSNH